MQGEIGWHSRHCKAVNSQLERLICYKSVRMLHAKFDIAMAELDRMYLIHFMVGAVSIMLCFCIQYGAF